ncbi:hypothetical protein PoB_003290100 [Plakobranchus ocellatus]|uniref:Uncharacterized protein n=1 Tax=Plakobranchus ocellatus TaxID=259542 RepID=A0AAV4ADE4_9GAST|nr:hypothetical protein PoB_003290100 [Plakobranchus ocellatus]
MVLSEHFPRNDFVQDICQFYPEHFPNLKERAACALNLSTQQTERSQFTFSVNQILTSRYSRKSFRTSGLKISQKTIPIMKSSRFLRTPRIGWSGLMQAVLEGSYYGKSTITVLSMIDMQPKT